MVSTAAVRGPALPGAWHGGWGWWVTVLARLTAVLVKKLLYNLQGASAL